MKIDKKKELKAALEKLGYKVYFRGNHVKIIHSGYTSAGVMTKTFREAWKMAHNEAGDGKSVRPWMKTVKQESRSVIRARVREQINKVPKGNDDVFYPPKLASDPWSYD